MSLINKMLKDLDARGSKPGQEPPPSIPPLGAGARNKRLIALGAAAAVVFAVAAGVGFWWLKKAARPARVLAATPQVVTPAAQQIPPEVVDEKPGPAPEQGASKPDAPGPQTPEPPAPEPAAPAIEEKPAPPKPPAPAIEEKPVLPKPPAAKARLRAPAPKAAAAPAEAGRHTTPAQRAESEYRSALASLTEGRGGEAVAALEQAIRLEPRHDAARQTLVGLLVEAGRKDEALRVLQTGLTLDARQPAMAMLMARLEIERGGSGIETLMRTLPYAAGNGEYHAFFAGALARAERHREAAEQYQAALRSAPANGVWWMGLGMSLQAEKRTAEAVEAFRRAKDSPNLTPQLRAFVDRKLQLLSH